MAVAAGTDEDSYGVAWNDWVWQAWWDVTCCDAERVGLAVGAGRDPARYGWTERDTDRFGRQHEVGQVWAVLGWASHEPARQLR